MSKIFNFERFLNEAKGEKNQDVHDFFAALREASEASDLGRSFSAFANGYSRKISDPEADYAKLQKAMDKLGWDAKKVETIFETDGNEIVSSYNDQAYPTDMPYCYAGPVDYYLWKHDNRITLSGYDWKEIVQNKKNPLQEEYWIKFGYGYHRTPYGRLAVEQHYGSMEAWYEYGLKNLADDMFVQNYGGSSLEDWTEVRKELKEGYKYDLAKKEATIDLTYVKKKLGDRFNDFVNVLKEVLEYSMFGDQKFGKWDMRGDIVHIDFYGKAGKN